MNIDQLKGNWNYPTPIRLGRGRISELAEVCKAAGIERPLLVTDPGLAGLDMVSSLLERNESAGLPTGTGNHCGQDAIAQARQDAHRRLC
jgi:alcohol dehydrogenase class IV